MNKETWYRSDDGKFFNNLDDCLAHEEYQQKLQARMREAATMDLAKLENLIQDLKSARQFAHDFTKNGFMDTIGSAQCRALKAITSVCKKFVEENKESLNWY